MRGKKISLLVCITLVFSLLAACGKKEEEVVGGTVATDLYASFKSEIENEKDLEKVARTLLASDALSELATDCVYIEEGYLNGFDGEITGFKKGIMFAPMIGTIPFVGYIFETDAPDALVNTLSEHAMLNWNICTVADEMVVKAVDNYVFFVMAPESFDQ